MMFYNDKKFVQIEKEFFCTSARTWSRIRFLLFFFIWNIALGLIVTVSDFNMAIGFYNSGDIKWFLVTLAVLLLYRFEFWAGFCFALLCFDELVCSESKHF